MLIRPSLCTRAGRISTWLPRCCLDPAACRGRQFCPERDHNVAASRRTASSASKRWQTRQEGDKFSRDAKVQGLKSRAAFKLLEINEKFRIFKKGQTVVDLGYAPGSWSQVAVDRTAPGGRVIGIDIIPAQPPKGVSTIQGNFLSEAVQNEVKRFLRHPEHGKIKEQKLLSSSQAESPVTEADLEKMSPHLLEGTSNEAAAADKPVLSPRVSRKKADEAEGRMVDLVLSDMCEPWEQTSGFYKRSLSDPYYRMMNTSGMAFRDHAGSMDLCNAALLFAFDTLRTGGHFVCKFYQGAEDKVLEQRLKMLFKKVHREKPEASRSESKESFFVALRRREGVEKAAIWS